MISMWSRPRKPQRKPKPRATLGFGLVDEAGVVELELGHGGLEMLEVGGVDRVNAAEDHRLDELEAGQGRFRGCAPIGERVTDFDFAGRLDVGDDVADVAGIEDRLDEEFRLLGLEETDFP